MKIITDIPNFSNSTKLLISTHSTRYLTFCLSFRIVLHLGQILFKSFAMSDRKYGCSIVNGNLIKPKCPEN